MVPFSGIAHGHILILVWGGKKIWLLDWFCIQIHEFLYASFLSEYGDIYHEYAIRIIYITTKIGLWFIIDVSCPPLT